MNPDKVKWGGTEGTEAEMKPQGWVIVSQVRMQANLFVHLLTGC